MFKPWTSSLRPVQGFRVPACNGSRNDILYGIPKSETIVANTKASAEERAVSLSWFIHLIGDIHQPLHCCSLFDGVHPAGIRGATIFMSLLRQEG